ncbi:glycosyltransferase [Arthrobacter agilis]|uniref:glycosyltransferase n=1 Tax=Arthrobacter agilis TaxID=37921 RepID=UPI00236600C7|nr:glycosyltransferase [Arthrobacter agilis]WDF34220.1 glycosyltransferase [Arthrobacter agilis]
MTRLVVVAPPGVTRPGIRGLTAALLGRAIRDTLSDLGATPTTVLTSFPLAVFPHGVPGTRVLYVTDDWLGGSRHLGFSSSAIRRALVSNLWRADVIAAVSPVLAEDLNALGGGPEQGRPPACVLANGCPEQHGDTSFPRREPVAGVVGQLNERLDLDVLKAVQKTGVQLRLIGPRLETTRAFRLALDSLLRAPNVSWAGAVPAARVRTELDTLGVGLTPYADTPFNRASFPLKTLEYLGAGLDVVSTDLPSVRWLASGLIAVGQDPEMFAGLVTSALTSRNDKHQEQRRRDFASQHSWKHRASELIAMITTSAAAGTTRGRNLS